MKKIFVSILSIFALGIIFCNTASVANAASSSSEGTIVATVSLNNAKIISNTGRDYQISFDISNRVGAQPQVKYAVRLTRVSAENETSIDEKVYEEILSLGENTTISKTINYSIPASTPVGTYRIWIDSENESGLMLGIAMAGEAQVTESVSNTVEIVPDSCSIVTGAGEFLLTQGISINSTDMPTVKCKVTSSFSSDVTLMPNFVTKNYTSFGSVVSDTVGGSTEGIIIKKGDNDITLALPKVLKPQGYNLTFSLISSDKKTISNTISLNYTLTGSGQIGKIQNVIFDKISYKAGETAHLQIFSTQTGTSTIAALVLNDNGDYCSVTSNKEIPHFSVISLSIPITKDCANPKANIILSAGGNVLDSKNFRIATSNTTASMFGVTTGKITLTLILIVFALILGALILKKKHSGIKGIMVAILVSVGVFSFNINITHACDASGCTWGCHTNHHCEWWICHDDSVCNDAPPATPPTGLTAVCPAPGTTATISWDKVSNVQHDIRVDNTTNGWNGGCSGGQLPGDVCLRKAAPGNYTCMAIGCNSNKDSYSFTSVPGVTYTWWVHSVIGGDVSSPASGPAFTCTTACTSWGYSAWGACSAAKTQTRTITASYPSGCVGGTPAALVQACPTCTSWTYSAWGTCSPTTRTQTRTITSSSPANCAGGTPAALVQACTPLPTNTLSASAATVSYNQSATLSGTVADANSCTLAGGPLGTRAWSTNGSFSYTTGSLTANTSFVLSCSGPGGGPVTKTVTISVIPLIPITLNLDASPLTVLSGSSSMISWNITGADSCVITKNGVAWRSFTTSPAPGAGSGNGQFNAPWGVAVDSAGNMYVADTNNNRIQKFNSSGVYVSQFGSAGSGNGQFGRPMGVAVDSSGNIYVADSDNNRIQKFNSSGVYLSKIGPIMFGPYQRMSPWGIAVDSSGNIYSTFYGHGWIVRRYNSSGAQTLDFNPCPNGSTYCNPQFMFPAGIAADSAGNIYITNVQSSNDAHIFKFNSSGAYISKFGPAGSGNGQFFRPYGIILDSSNNIYVTDTSCGAVGAGCDNNRVQKFNSSGAFLLKFGGTGTGNGQFNYPIGITRDSSNNIYVTDIADQRIQKFNSSGTYLSKVESIVSAPIAGSQSSGNLTAPATFTAQCNNSGNSATKSVIVDVTTPPKPTVILNANESEIRWEVTDATSCTLTEEGVGVISTAMSGSIIADESTEGQNFTLTCTNAQGTVSTSVIGAAPAVSSGCTAMQAGNAAGDANIYVNKNMTWTVNLSATGTTITSRKWSGTNVPEITGSVLNKIYTTVGKKNIQVKTTGTVNGKPFVSTCHATTTVKLAPGTGGEI